MGGKAAKLVEANKQQTHNCKSPATVILSTNETCKSEITASTASRLRMSAAINVYKKHSKVKMKHGW